MPRTGVFETQLAFEDALERDATGEWTRLAKAFIQARIDNDDADFTSDDIRYYLGDPPGTGNILGALLSQGIRAGRLEVVGRVKSSRPGRHRARIQVYRRRSA